MDLRLFHALACPFSMRSRIALAEKGLPWESVEVDLGAKPPELLACNPFGTVPTLVADELVLYESNVVNLYLETLHPSPPLLPAEPAERARALLWAQLADTRLVPPIVLLVKGRVPGCDRPANEADRAGALAEIEGLLALLARELADRDHPVASFSLADVAFAPFLLQLERYGYPADRIPASVQRWRERLAARPSVEREVLAHLS